MESRDLILAWEKAAGLIVNRDYTFAAKVRIPAMRSLTRDLTISVRYRLVRYAGSPGDRPSGEPPGLSTAPATAGAPPAEGQPGEPEGESIDHREHEYTREDGGYTVPVHLRQRCGKDAVQCLLEIRGVVL